MHAVNVRGCVSSDASLFIHIAVALVTRNKLFRYEPRTTRPICFVTMARTIIADTKNIPHRRCSSTHTVLTRALVTWGI